MSVVVGVKFNGGVILAGDSQWSDDNSNRLGAQSKVHSLSDTLAIGYVGSARFGQILQFHLSELEDPFLPRDGRDEEYWAVREFIPYLRAVTEEQGHLHIKHNAEHFGESAFLLAVRGRLFLVENDFSVSEHSLAYEAVGSGGENAIGALHSDLGFDPEVPYFTEAKAMKAAEKAVSSAITFNNYVGGDIISVQTVLYTEDEIEIAKRILGQ
jgi:20S proteasome alpha/beta subunit